LTPSGGDHKISPESSDGFASVGTILPREEAALLPGGLFVFLGPPFAPVFTGSESVDTIPQGTCKRGRADVAQLVEQLIRNQQVIGSSPIVGSINSVAPHLYLAHNLKRLKHFLSLFLHPVWYRLIHCFFEVSLAVELNASA
jgi:hypothetical protein